MHREKTFKTTRSRLASVLMANGYTLTAREPNPYNPECPFFCFQPVDERLLDLVCAHYAEVGKEPPAFVGEWQKGFDRKAEKGGKA